jgi:hypothetical protein
MDKDPDYRTIRIGVLRRELVRDARARAHGLIKYRIESAGAFF